MNEKGLDSAINYIERYSGENTVRVIETSKTPFNEETSKIIDNMDKLHEDLKRAIEHYIETGWMRERVPLRLRKHPEKVCSLGSPKNKMNS
jgi:hypothetical protein